MYCRGSHLDGLSSAINDTKTELVIFGSYQQLFKVSMHWVDCCRSVNKPVECVRNLGAWFDNHMFMGTHVVKVWSKAFRGQYTIRQIRKFLCEESAKTSSRRILTIAILFYMAYLIFSATSYRTSLMLLLGWFVLFRSLTISLLFWLNCTGYLSIFEFNSRFFHLFSRR